MTSMTEKHQEYRIEAVANPTTGHEGVLSRILFPRGSSHAYLRLTADAGEGLRRTLAELHFTGKDKTGDFAPFSRKPLNLMISVASFIGLEAAFTKAIDKIGLGGNVARLKGIHTGERRQSTPAKTYGSVGGAPEQIMRAWNRACAAALEINKANLPFTALGPKTKGPINCRSGIRTVLEAMGDEFRHMAHALQGDRPNRNLVPVIPSLQARLPDREQIGTITLSSLKAAQRILSNQLFVTSRMLNRDRSQPVPRSMSPFQQP